MAVLFLLTVSCLFCGCTETSEADNQNIADNKNNQAEETLVITDAYGREVTVPKNPQRVVCSGAGCLRLLSYLGGNELVVGVDNIDQKDNSYDKEEYNARAYYLAYPQYADLPLIGNHHSNDNPELIIACNPQVIFRTNGPSAPLSDQELQEKTGIPVVGLDVGDPVENRGRMYDSLKIMGSIIGKEDRADEVCAFFESQINNLAKRVSGIEPENTPRVYIAGISSKGPQGLLSTTPLYAPFSYIDVDRFNVANDNESKLSQAFISKEKLIDWNPDFIFVELGTVQLTPSAIDEIRDEKCYKTIDAIENKKVYGLLPYNWYTYNYGTAIISSYYAGKIIYPDQFEDVVIKEKADEIFNFLFNMPLYDEIDRRYDGIIYKEISL